MIEEYKVRLGIGNVIKQKLDEMDMTQEDLAEKSGYSRAHINSIINVKGEVKLSVIIDIANALSLDLRTIFNIADVEKEVIAESKAFSLYKIAQQLPPKLLNHYVFVLNSTLNRINEPDLDKPDW